MTKGSPGFGASWVEQISEPLREGTMVNRVDRLKALMKVSEGEALNQLMRLTMASPDSFDPVTLAQSMSKLLKSKAKHSPLLKYLIKTLEQLTAQTPPPPTDYIRALTLPNTELPAYAQIVAFMSDPHTASVELAIGAAERQKVTRALEASGAALAISTIKKGSPYRLLLTKTLADHQQELKAHQQRLSLLDKLKTP